MKVVNCPNCGAASSDSNNCEFCGSLFVRAEKLGYDLSSLNKEEIYNSNTKLCKELEHNIRLQKEYDCDCFSTQIFRSKTDWEELNEPIDGVISIMNADFSTSKRSKRGSISLDISSHSLSMVEWEKFLELPEFVLFEKIDEDWYKMEFGEDVHGAAYLTSKILTEVLGFDLNKAFYFTSVDCVVDGNIEDLEKWEQSQPMEIKNRIKRRNDINPENTNNQEVNLEKSGPCFIATATMNDFHNPVVVDLRKFRDQWILKQQWGESFVKNYYKYGSKVAKVIEGRYIMRAISFVLIVKPLHFVSKLILKNN
jgi:hypothetical protein